MGPKGGDGDEIRFFVDLAVNRVVDGQHVNQSSWDDHTKASVAARYYELLRLGATGRVTDSDMLDTWAEHVQFTKQYRQHVALLGHAWESMIPAKYSSESTVSRSTHHVSIFGQIFPLPGMDEVAAKQGWASDQLEAAVAGYGQFLRAVVANTNSTSSDRPPPALSPSKTVDEIWHQHIRHGLEYSSMGKAVFGRYLQHRPHLSSADRMTGPSSYARTLGLISGAGEKIDSWVWPPISTSDDCTQPRCSDCQPSSCGGGGCGCGESY